MSEKLNGISDLLAHLPWMLIGMTHPRHRTTDDDDSHLQDRDTDPTLRMWMMLVAAVVPFMLGMIWVQSEIRSSVKSHNEQARREFQVYADAMERRVQELERFRLAGGRFTDKDGKELRQELLEYIRSHESRLDKLEQPGSDKP